jgi:large subunit ribosomal protein L15
MRLGELAPNKGAKKRKFRVGRGHGSGNGKTAGKGHKGQNARSGGTRIGFEGGQMPLYRRIPKRGHKCRNSKEIIAINVERLNVFADGDVVDIDALKAKGLVSNPRDGVKILGKGKIERNVTVKVNFYSQSAVEKIQGAGGKAEVV